MMSENEAWKNRQNQQNQKGNKKEKEKFERNTTIQNRFEKEQESFGIITESFNLVRYKIFGHLV